MAADRSIRGDVPPLYALADRDALGSLPLATAVAAMLEAGIRWIQVRAKKLGDRELAAEVAAASAVVGSAGLPDATLWVNDRPDLARMFECGGVHLGQEDLPPAAATSALGAWRGSCLIGQSTHNPEQVERAQDDPEVDVVAIGPVFATTGKKNADPVVGLEGVRWARELTDKPLVAIGGIDESNLEAVFEAGADSAAVLGALCRAEDGGAVGAQGVARRGRRLVAIASAAAGGSSSSEAQPARGLSGRSVEVAV